MKRTVHWLLLAILTTLVSCGGSSDDSQPLPPPEPSITVSPATASVNAGATRQFTATVVGFSNTAVTWQVDGVAGGSATTGTVNSAGLYTAPVVPPPGGTVTVTAVLQADPTFSDSAVVAVRFSNISLSGPYVFNFIGTDADGLFVTAGSFESDGAGNLTNGLQDLNHPTGVFEDLAFSGTYSIGPDGRGTMSVTSSFATLDFRLVLTERAGRALLMALDATANGTGVIRQPGASGAVANDDFVFRLDGVSNLGAVSLAGRFTLDATGGITGGVLDANDGGALTENSAFTGNSISEPGGRITASLDTALGPLDLRLYPFAAGSFLAVSLNFIPAVAGQVVQQNLDTFSDTDFSGDHAFLSNGFSPTRVASSAGRFSADGAGGIAAGLFDENDTGAIRQNVIFTGMYSVAPSGRAAFTLISQQETLSFAFYLTGAGGFFVRLDPDLTASGEFQPQSPGPFSAASLGGNLGLLLTGVSSSGEFDLDAQFVADGAGNLSGTVDINDFGALFEDFPIAGIYTVSPNGRGTLALDIGGEIFNSSFYATSDAHQFFVGVDTTEVIGGEARRQF